MYLAPTNVYFLVEKKIFEVKQLESAILSPPWLNFQKNSGGNPSI